MRPLNWILGFLFSFLIIWIISFFFSDTLVIDTWSPEIGTWIRVPGSIHRHRSEGWGTSRFGQMDVIGVEDISKIGDPAIAIWGDSYVEAFQVEQRERMQEVLNGIWRAKGISNHTAFGIGNSGESIADYYFKMPRYEKKCPAIQAHFIILSSMSDVLPDQSSALHGTFQSKPELRLVENKTVSQHKRIKSILRNMGFDFLWQPVKTLLKDVKLRFSPGKQKMHIIKMSACNDAKESNDAAVAPDPGTDKAFCFLLHALKHQTDKPVIFVYCPFVPAIDSGHVRFSNSEAEIASLFAKECRKNGFGFVDMTREFCSYYRKTGTFPRGFPNTRPSQGHFNSCGHKLIANAIYWASLPLIGEHHAVHAD